MFDSCYATYSGICRPIASETCPSIFQGTCGEGSMGQQFSTGSLADAIPYSHVLSGTGPFLIFSL